MKNTEQPKDEATSMLKNATLKLHTNNADDWIRERQTSRSSKGSKNMKTNDAETLNSLN